MYEPMVSEASESFEDDYEEFIDYFVRLYNVQKEESSGLKWNRQDPRYDTSMRREIRELYKLTEE